MPIARPPLAVGWLALLAWTGLMGCEERRGRLSVELEFAEGLPATGFVQIDILDAAGAPVARSGPHRVTSALNVDIPAVPHAETLIVQAEVRRSEWANAPVRQRGRSAPFDFAPDSDLTIIVRLELVDDATSPTEAGVTPLLDVRYVRRPWGGQAGPPIAAVVGRSMADGEAVVFDGPTIDGPQAGASVLGRTPVREGQPFEVSVGAPLASAATVYLAFAGEGNRLVDTSSAAGLQAAAVATAELTASFQGKIPGRAFPNPHVLTVSPARSKGLENVLGLAREATGDELADLSVNGGGGFSVVSTRYWQPRTPSAGPVDRSGGAAAFDEARGRMVFFGGAGLTTEQASDTWEWNGDTWSTAQVVFEPPARDFAALVYDSARGETVLFGGQTNAGTFGDLWAWDGNRWTEVPVVGPTPSARGAVEAVYDRARGRMVIYGGCSSIEDCSVPLDELWELDGDRWVRFEPEGPRPPPVQDPLLVYDTRHRRVLMLGGVGRDFTVERDIWAYNGQRWYEVEVEGSRPEGLIAASVAYDEEQGRVLLYEGVASFEAPLPSGDLWAFDGTRWTRLHDAASGGPAFRIESELAYDTRRREVLLIGGTSPTGLTATWSFKDGAWRRRTLTAETPPARIDAAMAYDPERGRTVLFGGQSGLATLGDLWDFDGRRWRRRTGQDVAPTERTGAVMAYDPGRGGLIMTGGAFDGEPLSETWRLDGDRWTLLSPNNDGRAFGALTYDGTRGELVLFGGIDEVGVIAQTRLLGPTDDEWRAPPAGIEPPPRFSPGLAYDPQREVVVTSGGVGFNDTITDHWEWNGSSWTFRDVALAGMELGGTGLVYDPTRGQLLLIGGLNFVAEADVILYRNDVWAFDDPVWARDPLDETRPSGRAYFSTTYHPGVGALIFGGEQRAEQLQQTWAYSGRIWRDLTAQTVPDPRRCNHAVAADRRTGQALMFGGCPDNSCAPGLSTTVEWTAAGWVEPSLEQAPPSSTTPILTPGPAPGELLLVPDVLPLPRRLWRFADGRWRDVADLPLVFEPQAAFDEDRQTWVSFGGFDSSTGVPTVTDMLYERVGDGPVESRGRPSGPGPRYSHAMVWMPGRGVILHGGRDADETPRGDTWRWDGASWQQLADGPVRSGHALTYDPVRGTVLLVGGVDDTVTGRPEVFELDGQQWRLIPTTGARPVGRLNPGLFFDGDRQAAVYHGGGIAMRCLNDTWLFPSDAGLRPAARAEIDIVAADIDLTTIRRLQIRVVAGGLGATRDVPPTDEPRPGVSLEVWNAWEAKWIDAASGQANVNAPTLVEATLERYADIRRSIDRAGRLRVRVSPADGIGSGASPSVLLLQDIEATVEYDAAGRSPARCGDGIVQPDRGESCDDGNAGDGDGCSGCAVDAGFICEDADPSSCMASP